MNNENKTKEKLANILEGAKDVHRTFEVIYSYCEHYAHEEKIYNALHMMKYILEKSESVAKEIQYLYDSFMPEKKDQFIEQLKQSGNFTDCNNKY